MEEDEREALLSVYSDDSLCIEGSDISLIVWRGPVVTFRLILPCSYPCDCPAFLLESSSSLCTDDIRTRVDSAIQEVWEDSAGEPCIIALIERVRAELDESMPEPEHMNDTAPGHAASEGAIMELPEGMCDMDEEVAAMAAMEEVSGDGGQCNEWTFQPAFPKYGQRPVHFNANSVDERFRVQVSSGETITDRKSTFQAHLAVVSNEGQVQWVKRHLLENHKIARATHNMIGYRYWDDHREVQVADNDDDGEDGAGSKIAGLLDMMGVQNVFIMVSRWYGGIKLGPDRFKHIATATQKVLEDCGFQRASRGPKKGHRK